MPLPPQITQAEAILVLTAVHQIVQRLLQRQLGAHTRNRLRAIQALIAPLLDRHDRDGC